MIRPQISMIFGNKERDLYDWVIEPLHQPPLRSREVQMIRSSTGEKERQLFFGPPGGGKSKAYLDIYDNIDTHMYIVDTDVATERMFTNRDQSRATITEATDYITAATALLKYNKIAKAGDWLVVDMITPTWGWRKSTSARARNSSAS